MAEQRGIENAIELDKTKLIVTACPHKDRAALVRMYLTIKGYRAKYLKDGLLGLVELLRGDRAQEFINNQTIKSI